MKVGIVGAGILGLTLALRLSERGHRVEVFEAGPQAGGLSTWQQYGDFTWDKYYHVILRSDAHLLGLIDELGLSPKLQWTPVKTGFLWRGKHVSMSNHWEFLRFPVLNLYQKFRLGAGILYSQRVRDVAALERQSAVNWLTKVFGQKVYATIWEPLLESKFGVLKEKVPATIIWSTILRYASTQDKSGGKSWMGHLRSTGMKELFDALQERLRAKDVTVHYDCRVDTVQEQESQILVNAGGSTFSVDRLISTLPTQLLKRIAPSIQNIYSQSAEPEFLGVIRLALVLKKQLSPYYVTNLIDRGLPFTGIIEVSSLSSGQEFAGKHLVMLPRYDVPSSAWFQKSDDEIRDQFLGSLKDFWPDIDQWIEGCHVSREKIVQALWIQSPPESQAIPRSACGRVWSINAELAGRDTLNNNAIVGVAENAAKEFLSAHET